MKLVDPNNNTMVKYATACPDLNDDEAAALYSHGRLRYDEAGNLIYDRQGYAYKYDYENRLTKIQQDGSDIVEYTYDALGRRVEKKDHVTSDNTRRYFYSKDWQVLDEYDFSDTLAFCRAEPGRSKPRMDAPTLLSDFITQRVIPQFCIFSFALTTVPL